MIDTPPLKYPDALWTENGVAAAKEGETLTRTHTERNPCFYPREKNVPASQSLVKFHPGHSPPWLFSRPNVVLPNAASMSNPKGCAPSPVRKYRSQQRGSVGHFFCNTSPVRSAASRSYGLRLVHRRRVSFSRDCQQLPPLK